MPSKVIRIFFAVVMFFTSGFEREIEALELGFQARDVIAINILLLPDDALLSRAEAVNAKLMEIYPEGFALDDSHQPHITLIQRYVHVASLENVYAAANEVLRRVEMSSFKLEAFEYDYFSLGELGLTAITAKQLPELLQLQADLIEAIAPFAVKIGYSSAFFTTPDDPIIPPHLLHYVSTFVPDHSGDHFVPHLTVGLAPKVFLDMMKVEPFEKFTFSPQGAAVYQLGHWGTAARLLKELEVKQ
jgi:hypothetical protein